MPHLSNNFCVAISGSHCFVIIYRKIMTEFAIVLSMQNNGLHLAIYNMDQAASYDTNALSDLN